MPLQISEINASMTQRPSRANIKLKTLRKKERDTDGRIACNQFLFQEQLKIYPPKLQLIYPMSPSQLLDSALMLLSSGAAALANK